MVQTRLLFACPSSPQLGLECPNFNLAIFVEGHSAADEAKRMLYEGRSCPFRFS